MGEKNRFFYVGMAMGFVLAFAALWFAMPYLQRLSGSPQPVSPAAASAVMVDREGLARFMRAVEESDFAAMRQVGREIFLVDRVFPDSAVALTAYEATSHPPYKVYAFYSDADEAVARRVMLTLDDHDRVVSFMAEEMPVVP